MTIETFNWDCLAQWVRAADWFYMFAETSEPGIRSSTVAEDMWAIGYSIDPQRAIDVWESNFPASVRNDPIIGSGHTISNWIITAQRRIATMTTYHRDYIMVCNK